MLLEIWEIARDTTAIFLFGLVVLMVAIVAVGYREGILQ